MSSTRAAGPSVTARRRNLFKLKMRNYFTAKAMRQETVQLRIDKKMIREVADSLAKEMAESLYHELLILRYLPEVKLIESGKLKALRGEGVFDFLKSFQNAK